MIADVILAWGYVLLFLAVPVVCLLVGLAVIGGIASLFEPSKVPPWRFREDAVVRFVIWLYRRFA